RWGRSASATKRRAETSGERAKPRASRFHRAPRPRPRRASPPRPRPNHAGGDPPLRAPPSATPPQYPPGRGARHAGAGHPPPLGPEQRGGGPVRAHQRAVAAGRRGARDAHSGGGRALGVSAAGRDRTARGRRPAVVRSAPRWSTPPPPAVAPSPPPPRHGPHRRAP
ncbi:hypothetical protein BU14_2932s0001, partial [Porphyra umbilicalis]